MFKRGTEITSKSLKINPSKDVKMVELYFRDIGRHSGHAQIAELEIDYTPSLLWHGDKDIAEGKVYMRHVTCRM